MDISSKALDNEYKELYQSGKLEDLVKIIKTTFLRNKLRKDNNKKISEKDNKWFNKAEKNFQKCVNNIKKLYKNHTCKFFSYTKLGD